ncbi:hypothetical protein OUZ56_008585 [Daphnia magna]|uniref:Uncharacterized protein n=1 Tax=Daphnia magna TaxID=35525 RepID=A0ABR0ADF6_9CRUS|nr:hypothetical protein OUZ56_008585 [Daphnia magna]
MEAPNSKEAPGKTPFVCATLSDSATHAHTHTHTNKKEGKLSNYSRFPAKQPKQFLSQSSGWRNSRRFLISSAVLIYTFGLSTFVPQSKGEKPNTLSDTLA